MKRKEAPNRSDRQAGFIRVELEPEADRLGSCWQPLSITDWRRNWAEDIWPDCRT